MNDHPLPTAFKYLLDEPNLAVGAALAEALPDLAPFAQSMALEMLIRRAHTPSLSVVAAHFEQYAGTLSKLTAARAGDLAAGIQAAIRLPTLEHRRSAIALIVYGQAAELAYLLVDALRGSCRETRELAAGALRRLTAEALTRLQRTSAPKERVEVAGAIDRAAEAVASAIHYWEIHHCREVLETAFRLGERAEPALAKKLAEPKSNLSRVLMDMMRGASDPALAGFTLRALAHPALRASAVQAITRSESSDFLKAILGNCWMLADPSIAAGARRLQPGAWVQRMAALLPRIDEEGAIHLVSLFVATGGTPEQKTKTFQLLLDSQREVVARSTVWTLIQDERDFATELLRTLASRGQSPACALAVREVRRRQRRSGTVDSFAQAGQSPSVSPVEAAFDRFWRDRKTMDERECRRIEETLRAHRGEVLPRLRAGLASPEPLDRAEALHLAARLGWLEEVESIVHSLAHDSHALVRAAAVGLLAELRGPTTERILRTALDDPEHRVQANAVEAVDRLDPPARVELIEPKLASPSSRVRGNAVKSLLRTNLASASEALLDMLEHDDVSFRRSALWVIEHLHSRTVYDRLVVVSENDPDERIRNRARRLTRSLQNVPAVRTTSGYEEAHSVRAGGQP